MRVGRDDTVLGSDDSPTREGLPSGCFGRGDVGAECDGTLAGDDEPAVRVGQILGEGVVHGRRLEEGFCVALRSTWVASDVEHGRGVGHVEC